jgi:L-rhamnose-H+ transport protein
VILLGVAVCLSGIAFAGKAGMSKEREMSVEQKQATIKEFNLKKGHPGGDFFGRDERLLLLRSARRRPHQGLTLQHGTTTLWQGLPVLVPVLLGGFTTNFIWCVALNIKNRSGHEYLSARQTQAPMIPNYLLCALAGTTWYFQFFFYTMGETQMGRYKFSSWTLHMASIIIFSSLWGIALHEWRGASTYAGISRLVPKSFCSTRATVPRRRSMPSSCAGITRGAQPPGSV